MGGAGEGGGVADVDEDAGADPDTDAGHRGQDLRDRVGLQQFGDLLLQDFALLDHGRQ
jgi:hypothetical protein